jgi:hypothetical protein
MPVSAGDPHVVDGAIRAFYLIPPLHGGSHGAFGAGHNVKVLFGVITSVVDLLVVYRYRIVNSHGIPFCGARMTARETARVRKISMRCVPMGFSASDGRRYR